MSKLPRERFEKDALLKYNAYKSNLLEKNEKKPFFVKDFVLLELMAWFKNEFFKWVNAEDCSSCGNKENMKFKSNSMPNPSETLWMAGNVELYE